MTYNTFTFKTEAQMLLFIRMWEDNGTALFDKPAFKNVVVNGLVLAEDGLKMSKRLKNYPDPKIGV